jgi:protein-disulfide isomerase
VEKAAAEKLDNVRLQQLQCETKAKQQRHDVIATQARRMVQDRVLEAEAAKRGLSKEDLLATEIQGRAGQVTPEEAEAFYQQNKDRIGNRPKEQVLPQISQYLAQQRQAQAYKDFIDQLESKYQVAYHLEPFRVDLEVAGEPARGGPADAPVTIVEFSDFECPFCSRVEPTLAQVRETYGDKVRLVFKQFPLTNIHSRAQKAAEASLCAQDQGKFWELHDAMFGDQENLEVADLEAKAKKLGLDTAAFKQCLESGSKAAAVTEDVRQGSVAGVAGTPALFVNGQLLSGAVPYEKLAQTIDQELAARGIASPNASAKSPAKAE